MTVRRADGSAGDADYAVIGSVYARFRRPDPRIAAHILEALGDASKILNLGAGTGSYEPLDREVTAVEPSSTMRSQRPAHLSAAIDAVAEHLPFADNTFDAAMATFSVHQWSDVRAGLREMRRVTRGPVVLLTCDPAFVKDFWLNDYAPEVLDAEARRYPANEALADGLGGTSIASVPIPLDCWDGFNEAYYGRPEMLLDPAARLACSSWSFLDDAGQARFSQRLSADLESGVWDQRLGHLRTEMTYDGSLVLISSIHPEGS